MIEARSHAQLLRERLDSRPACRHEHRRRVTMVTPDPCKAARIRRHPPLLHGQLALDAVASCSLPRLRPAYIVASRIRRPSAVRPQLTPFHYTDSGNPDKPARSGHHARRPADTFSASRARAPSRPDIGAALFTMRSVLDCTSLPHVYTPGGGQVADAHDAVARGSPPAIHLPTTTLCHDLGMRRRRESGCRTQPARQPYRHWSR